MNYGWRFVTLYRRQWSRSFLRKRNAKDKRVVWRGLTNSCVPGATTGDPTHDRVTWKRTVKQGFRTQGLPRLSRAPTPKPESVCFTISWLSPTPLILTGGYPWPPFSRENQFRAIANKFLGHERNISNQTPSVSIITCLAGISRLLQLRIWLFTSSQLWEAWKT